MAAQSMTVLEYPGITASLSYDDVSLVVSSIDANNTTTQPCSVTVENIANPAINASGVIPANSNRTFNLPANALKLTNINQTGKNSLSIGPWRIRSVWP